MIESMTCYLARCDWCGVPGPACLSPQAVPAEAAILGWESVGECLACPACLERGLPTDPEPPATCRVTLPDADGVSVARIAWGGGRHAE